MGSKPLNAVASAASGLSALFMLMMAYQFGFMPGGFFGDAALLNIPLWAIVAGLSASLVWLSCAHLRWLMQGPAQAPVSQLRGMSAG